MRRTLECAARSRSKRACEAYPLESADWSPQLMAATADSLIIATPSELPERDSLRKNCSQHTFSELG